jgi:hypothetical protein
MTAKDKNKQTMGNSVTQTLENNKPEWAAKPVFADSVTTHENNMGAIQSWSEKQQQTLEYKGLVRDKNLLKLIMVDMLVREISAIKAYSVKTGNSQLASSVNYSKSKLNKMSDAQFLAAATIVNDTAIANADALKDFGITDEMTTTMKGDLTAFNSIMKKPKALLSQLKMFTSNWIIR